MTDSASSDAYPNERRHPEVRAVLAASLEG
jgi:hypothetical protein